MDETLLKSNQEQAVASWINYLNQLRLNELQEKLEEISAELEKGLLTQDQYLERARIELDKYLSIIRNNINRGGSKGAHGFIAEAAQTGIGNARRLIEGLKENHEFLDDNGVWDLKIDDTFVQMKFSAHTIDHMSLEACMDHLRKYPEDFAKGGKYMIPKDHYEKMKYLMSIPESQANKMGTQTGEFSLKEWKYVHNFVASNEIPQSEIIPSDLSFEEVQKGTYENTFIKEKQNLAAKNQSAKEELHKKADEKAKIAQEEAKPSLSEGAKATAVSAVVEGGTTFVVDVIKVHRQRGSFSEFSEDDWSEIAKDSGKCTAKGAVRGASIYLLTNYTATPAAVASSLVTASFGVAEQVRRYRNGDISETELIQNSELVCLDASVSAASSLIGQAIIPIPVVGAVIGNTVGTMMYRIAKDNFSEDKQLLALIEEYNAKIDAQKYELENKYLDFLIDLNHNMETYLSILPIAFSVDPEEALNGSVELAKWAGVPIDEILDTDEKIASYFLN